MINLQELIIRLHWLSTIRHACHVIASYIYLHRPVVLDSKVLSNETAADDCGDSCLMQRSIGIGNSYLRLSQ